MAESFVNANKRNVGIVTSYSSCTVAAGSTTVVVAANTGIGISDMVVNTNIIGGTKVTQIEGTTIYTDTNSTNTASASGQSVKFLGVTTAYTSAAATKSVIIGGTLTNNGTNAIRCFIEVRDTSASLNTNLVYDSPIPTGSSLIVSDAGKTLLEATDELRVYCDTASGLDANFSVLKGVS